MKIISNYLGREQRESWREEKNGKVNAKQEMGNESKGKGSERERESVLPLASRGSVARV